MSHVNRGIAVAAVLTTLGAWAVRTGFAQSGASDTAPRRTLYGIVPQAEPVYSLEDAFQPWPLAAADRAYGAIDGHHLHGLVVEQAELARRYRDQGHPQYWGRIIGTSADAESARWLSEKFTRIGLSDVRIQPIDLPPQWMPQAWEVTAGGDGRTLKLESAEPAYLTPGTPPEGLELEAVYAGTGSEADFAGRDVRGKAVFLFAMPLPGSGRTTARAEGAIQRAEDKGAAAVFLIVALPGNLKTSLYPTGTKAPVPTFTLGMEDGYAVRDLIGRTQAARPVRISIRLDVKMVPNLQTSLVWGTLPGTSDETVYVTAHRDGFFDAATDNASGVATMIGLAEYYAKIPRAERRRTMVFIGLDGHHNDAGVGRRWLVAHRTEYFTKTALMINAEHTSTLQTYLYWEAIRRSNTYTAQMWYAGGPSRPKLQDIAVKAFREFGVSTYAEPELAPPPGDLGQFYRFVAGVDAGDFNMYFHADAETPETVPWTGLEASTRAYARIIDEVNKLPLSDLQRADEPIARPPTPRSGALPGVTPIAAPLYTLEGAFLEWPLPAGAEAYRSIDGHRLFKDMVDVVSIGRRYRDQGHPQFWGRIIGTPADAETARWVADRFTQIGLSDVRIQPHDLAPQWMPESWDVTATDGAHAVTLTSAQPAYETPGTPADGRDLELVYVGTGSEADYIGRDVRGKAAVIYSMPLPGGTRPMATTEGAVGRAEDNGAAAVLLIIAQPGNMHTQLYPTRTKAPVTTFALGMEDGYALRDLIGRAPAGSARVRLRLAVRRVPDLKTATVWGTLPGATDETIYILAHRDGWFDAAGDNASGVATMIGLAEYYAKLPRAQRRRTLVFLGGSGHHNSASMTTAWLVDHKSELFGKTALFLNAEHTSTVQTYLREESVRKANTYTAQFWYAGGPTRPALQKLAIDAFRAFGVTTYAEPERSAPPGDLTAFSSFLPSVTTSDFNTYFHTDEETPAAVPWTGLEATTRAYARIIDGVNRLSLADLQRPPETPVTGR